MERGWPLPIAPTRLLHQQTLRQLQATGVDCVAVETDITDAGRCDQLIKTVADRFGRLDIIVNNVGDFRWGTLAESSLQDWRHLHFESTHGSVHVPRRTAAYAESTLGPNHQYGRRRRGARIRAGRKFRPMPLPRLRSWRCSRSLALEEAKNGHHGERREPLQYR